MVDVKNSLKINVDYSELTETVEKLKELASLLEKVNELISNISCKSQCPKITVSIEQHGECNADELVKQIMDGIQESKSQNYSF